MYMVKNFILFTIPLPSYYTCTTIKCDRGGIGRRAALRSLWEFILPWRFKSSRSHHYIFAVLKILGIKEHV